MTATIVTLDAGNTLFTERRSRDEMYLTVLRAMGSDVTLERLGQLRASLHDEVPDPIDGQPRYSDRWFLEFIRRLLAALELPGNADDVRATLADAFARPDSFVLFPDTLPALDDLTQRGVRLALISNWSPRLHELIDGLGLRRYFEVVVISAEIGATKPERAIFEHASSLLDAAPDRLLHVGDHPHNDLSGARRAGWHALLLDRTGTTADAPHVIRSLEEIVPRVLESAAH